ncbi:MAG TPA: hypothetical protein VN633_23225, partial [Bryobacteraceae bacterium]|nr:hypothetical protein [Bryobacteraceae bacterium]
MRLFQPSLYIANHIQVKVLLPIIVVSMGLGQVTTRSDATRVSLWNLIKETIHAGGPDAEDA